MLKKFEVPKIGQFHFHLKSRGARPRGEGGAAEMLGIFRYAGRFYPARLFTEGVSIPKIYLSLSSACGGERAAASLWGGHSLAEAWFKWVE